MHDEAAQHEPSYIFRVYVLEKPLSNSAKVFQTLLILVTKVFHKLELYAVALTLYEVGVTARLRHS
jgi:hypothetical protein